MKEYPEISVLITVYNDAAHIGNALDSILAQTMKDLEIVVVDDGSTDQTPEILKRYAAGEERIRVFTQPNQGTAAAANNGLRYCRGKYIARLDSDDISYPHRLETEWRYLEAHPGIDLVGGNCHIADVNGKIIGTRRIYPANPYQTLIHRCIYQQSDVMFRRSVLDKLGPIVYRGKFKGAEDYDLWLRISEAGGIAKIDSVFGVWRLNSGGYTLSRKQEQLEGIRELRRMAIARRKGQCDWYDQYEPVLLEKQHRTAIPKLEYDLVVCQVLLKEGRCREIREMLQTYRNRKDEWMLVRKWYYLSCLPAPLLRLLFGAREMVLNHTAIELR
jgi:glycosyltransferase involved in cell wall biosynthesis